MISAQTLMVGGYPPARWEKVPALTRKWRLLTGRHSGGAAWRVWVSDYADGGWMYFSDQEFARASLAYLYEATEAME